jgi:glutaredoxin
MYITRKYLILGILLVVTIVGIVSYIKQSPNSGPIQMSSAGLDIFAQCLADKNLTFYGASWCPHCQNQKKLFGESFKYIKYVECTEDTQLCTEKGISAYPTWMSNDGTKRVGELSFKLLSEASGCPIPSI